MNKGQVTPFLVLIMVVLILAIAATMLIGEVAFSRIRLANVGDSAAISTASVFCRALNQIVMSHVSMFLSYVDLQAAMLFASPFPAKQLGYAAAMGWGAIGIEMNEKLLEQAREIAAKAAENLRTSLYDAILGTDLIDEPKPFIEIPYPLGDYYGVPSKEVPPVDCSVTPAHPVCDEVRRETINDGTANPPEKPGGRVAGFHYPKYLKRDSHFVQEYRKFKKGEDIGTTPDKEIPYEGTGGIGGKDNWFRNNIITYVFNKSKLEEVQNYPGYFLNANITAMPHYQRDNYVTIESTDVPQQVSVDAMPMIIVFFYCSPTGCWTPGIILHPCAWIRRIDIDSNIFGLKIKKFISLQRVPFFGRKVELAHKTAVRIKGSVWTGYDFRLEE